MEKYIHGDAVDTTNCGANGDDSHILNNFFSGKDDSSINWTVPTPGVVHFLGHKKLLILNSKHSESPYLHSTYAGL